MKRHLRTLLSGVWALLVLGCLFGLLPEATDHLGKGLAGAGIFITLLVAAILRTKHPWSTWIVTVATVITMLTSLLLAFAYLSIGAMIFAICVVTLVFTWTTSTRAELRPKADFRTDAKHFFVLFIMVAFGASVLGFAIFEVKDVQITLKRMRLESSCKDPKVDVHACGEWGRAQVNSAKDEKEMSAGQALLDAMCKNSDAVACRRSQFTRMSQQLDQMTYRDLFDELWTRCQNEGGAACLVLALDQDQLPEEFPQVVKSKCSKTDLDACVAWAIKGSDHKAAHIKSCTLGISGSCTFGEVPIEVREAACAHSQEPWTCYAANGRSEFCDVGVWPACAPETWPEDRWGRISWAQRLRIKPAELTPSWENLQAGRETIRRGNVTLRPPPMPLTEIDQTFGVACDAGIAYGCIESADAATNVELEFRTQDRIAHAQKSLNKGCKNGDYLACGFLLSVAETLPENAVKIARNTCFSAPRGVQSFPESCRIYVHLWMADVGFTPWLMDNTLAKPEMVKKCGEQKDRFLCLAVAATTSFELTTAEPISMPQHVTAWNAAAISCSRNVTAGCVEMMSITGQWPYENGVSAEVLARDICSKRPQMCETVGQPRP